MAVQLNKTLINARLKSIYDGWNVRMLFSLCAVHTLTFIAVAFQNASHNDDLGSIANTEALLLLSGDPAAEDEPVRKGTAFQVSRTWVCRAVADLLCSRTDMVTWLRVPLDFLAFPKGDTSHSVLRK